VFPCRLSAAESPEGVAKVQGRIPSLIAAAVESGAYESSFFQFIFDVSSREHSA
jgi:hypothetical protein